MGKALASHVPGLDSNSQHQKQKITRSLFWGQGKKIFLSFHMDKSISDGLKVCKKKIIK